MRFLFQRQHSWFWVFSVCLLLLPQSSLAEYEPCLPGFTEEPTVCTSVPECPTGYTYSTSSNQCEKHESLLADSTVTKYATQLEWYYHGNYSTPSATDSCSITSPFCTMEKTYSTGFHYRVKVYFDDSTGYITKFTEEFWASYKKWNESYYDFGTQYVSVAPGSSVKQSNTRLTNQSELSYSCPSGYTRSGTFCVRTLTSEVNCPSPSTLNPSTDLCEYSKPDVPDPTFSPRTVENPDTSVSESEDRFFLFLEGISR